MNIRIKWDGESGEGWVYEGRRRVGTIRVDDSGWHRFTPKADDGSTITASSEWLMEQCIEQYLESLEVTE